VEGIPSLPESHARQTAYTVHHFVLCASGAVSTLSAAATATACQRRGEGEPLHGIRARSKPQITWLLRLLPLVPSFNRACHRPHRSKGSSYCLSVLCRIVMYGVTAQCVLVRRKDASRLEPPPSLLVIGISPYQHQAISSCDAHLFGR